MDLERKLQIKKTLQATKARRALMTCKVIECKVVKSSLNPADQEKLKRLFLEGKWLYNSILASPDMDQYDTKPDTVMVKKDDLFEERHLEVITSQMKQGMKARIFSSLSTLHGLKQNGHKVGKLKFKREVKSIPLKQHGVTFAILKKTKRIRIQGFRKPFKVNGLNQLPEDCEIANANLVKVGNDYFVKITIYTPKEHIEVPDRTIGIDFGCTTQLTLSNGEKIAYQVPVNKRVKQLDRKLSRQAKGSKNRAKTLGRRAKAYQHLVNQRKDISNKIVSKLVRNYRTICFQDEQLKGWARKHGRKVQFTAIGGIITALKNKAVTPIVVSKWYPSTQLCSACGSRQHMNEHQRTYLCPSCGMKMDRDINSAVNIEKEGLKSFAPAECREVPVEGLASVERPERGFLQANLLKQETPTSSVLG